MRKNIKLPILVIAIAVLAVFLIPRRIKAAQTSTCSNEQAKQALNLPDHYRGWAEAYRIFREFKGCDDGAIGEGFSEAIAQLFIHDWQHLDALVRLTASDAQFKKFVLWHIDATLSEDELHAIIRNTRRRCPVQDKPFCQAVEKNALASLKDLSTNSE
jgi:hypothetical protein